MAWRALDGRVSVMVDILINTTKTVSLAHICIDRPALTFHSDKRVYLAWTAPDQSIHVMSSADGLVYSGLVTLPGRSGFGPAIATFQNRLIVAWIDAQSGRLLMMNGLDAPVFDTKETSIAAPALASDGDDLFVSWTGSNALRQLNVLSTVGGPFPPEELATLPTDGPGAGTSIAGPSLGFKGPTSGGNSRSLGQVSPEDLTTIIISTSSAGTSSRGLATGARWQPSAMWARQLPAFFRIRMRACSPPGRTEGPKLTRPSTTAFPLYLPRLRSSL
jgi:hypothetical protein